jgi:hypothetical protein
VNPFTYRGHDFYLSNTTTTVRRWGREVTRWIIACDGDYGWRAGFHDRPTTVAEAKEHLRYKMGVGEFARGTLTYWIERLDDGSFRRFEQEMFPDGTAGDWFETTASFLPRDLELNATLGESEGLPIAEIAPVSGTVVATGWVFAT